VKSDRMRRASLGVGIALLVVALVILAIRPRTTFRAEAVLAVSPPIVASDVVAELRLSGVNARLRGARGVDADTTADDATSARTRVVEGVQRGVGAYVTTASTAAMQRAAASEAAGNAATTAAAAVVSASGVADPERSYRQVRAELARLEGARDTASTRGQPVADIDIRLASTQEKMFNLQFLVNRLAALQQTQQRAAAESRAAAKSVTDVQVAAGVAMRDLRVAVRRTAGWQGEAFALAVLGLVLAAVPAVARRRTRRRPGPGAGQHLPAGPGAAMSTEDARLIEETLARARVRRAATAHVDHGGATAGDGDEPHVDLVTEPSGRDAERPVGSA